MLKKTCFCSLTVDYYFFLMCRKHLGMKSHFIRYKIVTKELDNTQRYISIVF